MDNMLTLEKIQQMSIDDIVNAYRNGYQLYDLYNSNPNSYSYSRINSLQNEMPSTIPLLGLVFIAGLVTGSMITILLRK